MAAHRKPTNVLKLNGAFKQNPSRAIDRADEPEPDEELGPPPEHLSDNVRRCWLEIVDLAHKGTLFKCDRLVVEEGAMLLNELRVDGIGMHPTLLSRYERFLGKLGLSPADRSRIKVKKREPEKKADSLSEFAPARRAG